jgi:hypothetical protein
MSVIVAVEAPTTETADRRPKEIFRARRNKWRGPVVHPSKPPAKYSREFPLRNPIKRMEHQMKTYRLITLVAATLITVSLARVFTHEKVGDPETESSFTAAGAP